MILSKIIQQIIGLFLLLAGGISFNTFAIDRTKPEKPALLFLNTKTAPTASSSSVTMGSDLEGFSKGHRRRRNKEVLDTIHNAIQNILSSPETNDTIKFETETLKTELEEKVLSNNLRIPQVINFLRKRISEKRSRSYMRKIEIQMLGELLKTDTLTGSVILEIVDLLGELYSRRESNSFIRNIAMKMTGEILEKYIPLDFFPDEKISQILNQLMKNLFDEGIYIRKAAGQVIVRLLSQDIVPNPERRRFVFLITYRVPYSYWNKKVTALEVLGELLVQNIPSDPEDRRQNCSCDIRSN